MALANNTTPGSIVLAGDLTGNANAPELRPTGVIPGSYTTPNLVVDSKGRVVLASAGTIALAGDVTGSVASVVLAPSGVAAGSYTLSNVIVDEKGRVTAASSGSITLGGDMSGSLLSTVLSNTGVEAGTYTSPTITVDGKGRITSLYSDTITLSGDLNGSPSTNTLVDSGVTAGTYSASQFGIDAKGRITTATAGAFMGDIVGSPIANTLADTGIYAGTYDYPTITVDGKGRITSVGGIYASYSNKGLVQIDDNGLGVVSGIVAGDTATNSTNGMASIDTTHLTVSAGAIDVASSITKFDTGGQFTKAIGVGTITASSSYAPDLTAASTFVCDPAAHIVAPTSASNGTIYKFIVPAPSPVITGPRSMAVTYITSGITDLVINNSGVSLVLDGSIQYKDSPGDSGTGWTDVNTIGGETVRATSGIYTGSYYVVVGDSRSYASTDGITWTKSGVSINAQSNVTLGSDGNCYFCGTTNIYFGTPGSNSWTSISGSSSRVGNNLIRSNGYWIVAQVNNVTYTAASGASSGWSMFGVGSSFTPVHNTIASNGIVTIVAGKTGKILTILDVASNTYQLNTTNYNINSTWVVNGVFFAGAVRITDSVYVVIWSNDGINWTEAYSGAYLFAKGNYIFTAEVKWGVLTATANSPTFSSHYKFSNTRDLSSAVVANCTYYNGTSYCTYGGN